MSKQKEIEVVGHALYDSYLFSNPTTVQGVVHLKAPDVEEDARTSRGILIIFFFKYLIVYSACGSHCYYRCF